MNRNPEQVLRNALLKSYDKNMPSELQSRYYGHSGFFNFGFWTPETKSQREASENLVRKLLDFLPEKQGTILDVACGMGATTAMLMEHYSSTSVYGVNISPVQLNLALDKVPEGSFMAMDATHLGFEDETFDNIICVEAAFHFTTRTDFLREAYRVLKPGGRLVHSDILQHTFRKSRKANYLANPAALARNLESVGFTEVDVQDRTQECLKGFLRNIKAWPGQERKAKRMGLPEYLGLTVASRGFHFLLKYRIRYYLLSSARKPFS